MDQAFDDAEADDPTTSPRRWTSRIGDTKYLYTQESLFGPHGVYSFGDATFRLAVLNMFIVRRLNCQISNDFARGAGFVARFFVDIFRIVDLFGEFPVFTALTKAHDIQKTIFVGEHYHIGHERLLGMYKFLCTTWSLLADVAKLPPTLSQIIADYVPFLEHTRQRHTHLLSDKVYAVAAFGFDRWLAEN